MRYFFLRLDLWKVGVFIWNVAVMQYFANTVVELGVGPVVMPRDTSANIEEGGSQGFIADLTLPELEDALFSFICL